MVQDHSFINKNENNHESKQKVLKLKAKKRKKKNVTPPDHQQLAISSIEYLNKWKYDRDDWKFTKVKQMRLITNMFDIEKVCMFVHIFIIFKKYNNLV